MIRFRVRGAGFSSRVEGRRILQWFMALVPNTHILPPNLYHSYQYPKSKYP